MSRGADWPFLAGAAVAGRAELRGRGQGSGVADRGSGRRALTPVPLGASLFRCRGWRVRDLLSGIPGDEGGGSHHGRRDRGSRRGVGRSSLRSARPAGRSGVCMMGCARQRPRRCCVPGGPPLVLGPHRRGVGRPVSRIHWRPGQSSMLPGSCRPTGWLRRPRSRYS